MKPRVSVSRLLKALLVTLSVLTAAYVLWTPGAVVTDGRHDRGRNGLWMQHGWLGANEWFERNGKTDRIPLFRDPDRLKETAAKLRAHHITDLFPHLCPADPSGAIAPVDDAQVDRFLDAFDGFHVMPWVGGVFGQSARVGDPSWRAAFISSIRDLLVKHPRLAGVHVNIEPLPSGNADYLQLLKELRTVLPSGKRLSVAAYPPPTALHPYAEVHWDEAYFRNIATHVDQLVVMAYDTSLRLPKLYEQLLKSWTREILTWSESADVLIGVAAYDDAGVGYHDPRVENVRHSLAGIHAGLNGIGALPKTYQGVALYSDWEMDESEWAMLRSGFLHQ